MGQKVNPIVFRIKGNRTWSSVMYARDKEYPIKLHQDLKIRSLVKKTFAHAGISSVDIERSANKLRLVIRAARPGMIIGRKGPDIENLKKQVEVLTGAEVSVNIAEVKKPEVDSQIVADNICQQLEKRIGFRKAAKRALQTAMRMGAKGVRVNVSGRLGGAEIARTEWYKEGRVPLHTIRAEIDYATSEAHTTYGVIGVKVWIFKGETGVDSVKENNK